MTQAQDFEMEEMKYLKCLLDHRNFPKDRDLILELNYSHQALEINIKFDL